MLVSCGDKELRKPRKNFKKLEGGDDAESSTSKGRGSPAPCPICGMIISTPYNLACHLRRHQSNRPFKCEHCPSSFILKSELSRHIESHNESNIYKCSKCPKSYKSLRGLQFHRKRHLSRVTCRYCNLTFFNTLTRSSHEKTVHFNKGIKCKYCSKHFFENVYLENHILIAHKKKIEPKQNLGKKEEKKKREIIPKPIDHENFKFFPCRICQERFKFRKDQLTHYQLHHKEEFDKEFKRCSVCEKLLTKTYYPSHMRSHAGDLPFACHACDYKTAREKDLQQHMVVHSQEFKHKCQICNKGFRILRDKLVCEKRHSGVKDVKCRDCEKTFFTDYELRSHQLRKHVSRKCLQCEFHTNDIRLFKIHRNLHKNMTEQVPVSAKLMCEKCGLIVSNKAKLTNHVKKVHESNGKPKKTRVWAKYCSYCNFQGNSTEIFKHCLKVHTSKVLRCKVCSYSTLSQRLFNSHVESQVCVFGSSDIDKYFSLPILECFICGFTCVGKDKIGDHFDFHHESMEKFRWFNYHECFDLKGKHNLSIKRQQINLISQTKSHKNLEIPDKSIPNSAKSNKNALAKSENESQIAFKAEEYGEYFEGSSDFEETSSCLVKQETFKSLFESSKRESNSDSPSSALLEAEKNVEPLPVESSSNVLKIKTKKLTREEYTDQVQLKQVISKEDENLDSNLLTSLEVKTIDGKPFIPLEVLRSLVSMKPEGLTNLLSTFNSDINC